MTLTLEDKCEAKVNYDLAKIEFDLLMMRSTLGSVYTLLYSALIHGKTADSEFLAR